MIKHTPDEHDWLATQFEAHRTHLRAVAYRMLGSQSEAEDAVQESWLHLSRSETSGIENLGGWLTTVVARVCLDMLRSRKSRREEALSEYKPDLSTDQGNVIDPEQEVLMADSVGLALLVVLETLTPAERLAFVLHDMFAVPFDEIAPIVQRSTTATRQLASRARRRVQGTATVPTTDLTHQRKVVNAFLSASREGKFEELLALLDPGVVFRSDRTSLTDSAAREVRGAAAVAGEFTGRARGAQLVLINGAVGAMVAPDGQLLLVINFTIREGKIVEIEAILDPNRLSQLDLAALDN